MEFTKQYDWGENNDKSGFSLHFKHYNAVIKDPDQIYNAFCNFFLNVGPSHAAAMPQSKKTILKSYLALNVI